MNYKERAKKLLENLGEYNADYCQILVDADKLYQDVLEGYMQQKVAVGMGVVQVVEVYPSIAKGILDTKLNVLKELSRIAEIETEKQDTVVNINISPMEVEV